MLQLTSNEASLPQNDGVRFFAVNPRQQLTARFLDGAMRVASGRGGEWAGTLRFVGSGSDLAERSATPVARENRVEYQHPDGVTEWYVNRADGIEHGFTVAARPAEAAKAGELQLNLSLDGLTARAAAAEREAGSPSVLEFVNPASGAAVLRYSQLKVWDAAGREFPARFEARGERVAILVADVGAAYPLTIDPLITSQEAKLGPEFTGDGAAAALFGNGVALAGDTALVGASFDGSPARGSSGSVYVFVRSGMVWSVQAKLTSGDGVGNDQFGWSVALEADTALVGAPLAHSPAGPGSAYVFVRSGSVWNQQARLTAGNGARGVGFGISLALLGDTALVGALGDRTAAGVSVGSAYVFVRSGTVWSQQAKLTAGDGASGDGFGNSVALSGDIALIGAWLDDTAAGQDAGSAYVFVRSGTVWNQQAKVTAGDGATNDFFGKSVALSGDTALVGAVGDDSIYAPTGGSRTDHGSVYLFRLTSGAPEINLTGNSVGIADGDTTPSLEDHTDFGSALVAGGTVVRTFTIENTGTSALSLTGTPLVSVSGPNASDFTVTLAPASSVAAAGFTTFQVTFAPSASGQRTATLTIANDDGDESPYDFAIQGTGNTPPILTLPASPVTAEATSASGAAVTFTVTASDTEDGPLTPTLAPGSGTTFALGDTIVNVSASDSGGLTSNGSFIVRVQDTTPPVVAVHVGVSVTATSLSGANVTYTAASATDAVTASPTLTYSQDSGSMFPIGVTTVTITATDAANNVGTGTFTVTVGSPPTLTINRTTTNTVAVSWPSPSTGFKLQENTNGVATENWSNVDTSPSDDGSTMTFIIDPPTGNRFYRLFKP